MTWMLIILGIVFIFVLATLPELLMIIPLMIFEGVFHLFELIASAIIVMCIRAVLLAGWIIEWFCKLDRRISSTIGGMLLLALIATAAAIFS